jgi:hypothetical protein
VQSIRAVIIWLLRREYSGDRCASSKSSRLHVRQSSDWVGRCGAVPRRWLRARRMFVGFIGKPPVSPRETGSAWDDGISRKCLEVFPVLIVSSKSVKTLGSNIFLSARPCGWWFRIDEVVLVLGMSTNDIDCTLHMGLCEHTPMDFHELGVLRETHYFSWNLFQALEAGSITVNH